MNKKDLDPTESPLAGFGLQLRRSREAKGLTQGQLGALLSYSAGFISYVERGERKPKLKFAQRADAVLETGGTLELMWWGMYHASLYEGFPEFAAHEGVAATIRTFESGVIPGILQTREYMTVQGYEHARYGYQAPNALDERIAFRLGRQRALERTPPPLVHAVMGEGCLRRIVGGPAVMARQLRHLEAMCRRPNYVIQIAPFSLGWHPFRAPMTLLTLADGSRLGYTEAIHRGYLEREPEVVDEWFRDYDLLQVEALSQADSLAMIRAARREFLNVSTTDYTNASWLKSSYSGGGGQCIEIAPDFGLTLPVRDSKDPEGPALVFPTTSFTAFVNGVKSGQFNQR
ncbi:helix-turn-helix domain-containing protein [Kitasatospora kifunensis]|uniref:Transcriptional regulator with XRE-family HTH domain n=1 Tax=Kitasatospora kifunensis TaxID=58351 RepID=A0A7W7R786_KITKI|nr:Scr1 family TA system antitoxin-like transcriptional regulator [Kitasatospora kifunensis]MBB4926393.1 transcriptional regulator with XRE-family HTH domain [Kitasatospora kifunensis]